MCGIGAIFGKNIQNKEDLIRKSLKMIEHRGYSLYEIRAFGNCVLGCNRLEIVDRKAAIQPQTNEDETVFVILNGEVFNFEELKTRLEKQGHHFKTNSDTEVLAHLWEQYKEKMVLQIDSEMFAFVVYDKKQKQFFAARDPYGVKPFYFATDSFGNIHFASEIKQLAQFPEIIQIQFFPPGHYMFNGKLTKYHAMPKPSKKTKTNPQQLVLQLRRLVDQAVQKRVNTDLPVAVFFSGGVDSAAVLATARKYHSDVTAIIVGHENAPDVLTAKKYCIENNVKNLYFNPPKEKKLVERIPEIVRITESFEPNLVRQSSIAFFMAKIAQENGFRIALCGEGPDEIFAGYPEFATYKTGNEIAKQVNAFTKDLPRSQFQRVDRTSMRFTLELRVPFFDTALADFALQIPSEYKVRQINGKKITKWILREAMKDRLPNYIADRPKVVLSEGAGYKGNHPTHGLFHEIIQNQVSDKDFNRIVHTFPDWNIKNKEEAYYFQIFDELGYTKATFNQNRILTNAIHSIQKKQA